MAKNTGKYPKGHINQHKALATGAALERANTKNMDPSGFGPGGMGKGGKISSSGETGSGYKRTPPKSNPVTPC